MSTPSALTPTPTPAPGPTGPVSMELLTVAEVAQALRCSPATVRREVTRGRLPAIRLGRRGVMRIRAADLARLCEAPPD